jgi:4-hydroxy-tetrahydrodipicolinate reductase
VSESRIRIAIAGITGRMGRAIAAGIARSSDLALVGGIARTARELPLPEGGPLHALPPEQAAALFGDVDVVIDVSSGAALRGTLASAGAALRGRSLIVGTTGLDAEVEHSLETIAQHAAVLVAANFSIGVNVLLGLVERAARVLDAQRFDAEIIEIHHGRKADAPSGTALALGRALAQARGEDLDARRRDGRSGDTGARPSGEIGLHAVRGGGVIGEHRVLFLGENERVELAHAAGDRSLFADGALAAARWMAGRPPGRYTMSQVLGL